MKYTQPDLPYANNALEPAISKQTVEFHYGKHEKAYIDNLNNLIEGTEFADLPLEEPDGGGEPDGELRHAIDRDFGSFENFNREFVDAGVKLFGSGWVWLSRDNDGKLFITQESNAGSPLTKGLTPILTFDVWEHAYYLDYQNRRKDALERLWDIIDWPIVQGRY